MLSLRRLYRPVTVSFKQIDVKKETCLHRTQGGNKTGCQLQKVNVCEKVLLNVGCSNACRCEGCRNFYPRGRKEEYAMTQEIVSNRTNEESLEGMADEKLKMVSNNKFLHAELYDLRSLTPPTPSFEYLRMHHNPDSFLDKANVSQPQVYPGSARLSSGSSLRWHSSPITPMTRLASSPNKKRVSPPHSHIREFQSSSSAGLKSGAGAMVLDIIPSRKVNMQAVV
ncbi:hypothetical protein NC651_017176 [Populus alba x Populus x berolinensis]|nr:hypothetical protein NC651_017176 [Populus alba x Populus x berolinensis]